MSKKKDLFYWEEWIESVVNSYQKQDFSKWTAKQHQAFYDNFLKMPAPGMGESPEAGNLYLALSYIGFFHRKLALNVPLTELVPFVMPEHYPTPESALQQMREEDVKENGKACLDANGDHWTDRVRREDKVREEYYAKKRARAKIQVA